jgi:ureidoglycolate hydrolase
MKITSIHATPETFSRFGKVVNTPSGTPTSQGPDYKFWSDIANYCITGETEIGLCTVYRQPVAHVDGVERHMQTPEILIPIDAPFVLPIVEEQAGVQKVEAYRVNIGEAVIMNPGVWHGPCLPVGVREATYFVIFRKGTPHEDVVKQSINPVEVVE